VFLFENIAIYKDGERKPLVAKSIEICDKYGMELCWGSINDMHVCVAPKRGQSTDLNIGLMSLMSLSSEELRYVYIDIELIL
jgi:hypothetical protein